MRGKTNGSKHVHLIKITASAGVVQLTFTHDGTAFGHALPRGREPQRPYSSCTHRWYPPRWSDWKHFGKSSSASMGVTRWTLGARETFHAFGVPQTHAMRRVHLLYSLYHQKQPSCKLVVGFPSRIANPSFWVSCLDMPSDRSTHNRLTQVSVCLSDSGPILLSL